MAGVLQKGYFSNVVSEKDAHYHDCHQIVFVAKGEVRFCVNGATYNVGAGELIIFSRYENHSIRVLSDKYERYVLHLEPKVDGAEGQLYSLLINRPEGFCNVVDVADRISEFEYLFRRIADECNSTDILIDDMQQLLICQLLIMIFRTLPYRPSFNEMVYSIQDQFEKDCSKQYTLEGLAKRYNTSVSSLSHQFKKHTGVSVMEYLLSCRMAAAKSYLVKTDFSVGEIVEKCGFSDISNFGRVFRRQYGTTPSNFRKKYKLT